MIFSLWGCSEKIRLTPLGKNAVILAFGDSLTYGTGAEPRQSYPSILQNLTRLKVINRGIPGELSQQASRRFPVVVDEVQPDLIILCHGGNDFLRKLDAQHTKQNLAGMIRLAKQKNIPVILVSVPELKLLGGSARLYQELAKEFNLVLENGIINQVLRTPSLKSDAIHPNAQGYHNIAQALQQLLVQHGALAH